LRSENLRVGSSILPLNIEPLGGVEFVYSARLRATLVITRLPTPAKMTRNRTIALLCGFAASAFWLHALTVGVLATMILGVMTRVALGHTGRPLVVDPLIALAYILLLLAGLMRVFGFGVVGLNYPTVLVISASLWTGAFALFLYVYVPILWRPRADGKPG
jgi:uncharacterized protein involved in response to NO